MKSLTLLTYAAFIKFLMACGPLNTEVDDVREEETEVFTVEGDPAPETVDGMSLTSQADGVPDASNGFDDFADEDPEPHNEDITDAIDSPQLAALYIVLFSTNKSNERIRSHAIHESESFTSILIEPAAESKVAWLYRLTAMTSARSCQNSQKALNHAMLRFPT
jgi:hypothetical protein